MSKNVHNSVAMLTSSSQFQQLFLGCNTYHKIHSQMTPVSRAATSTQVLASSRLQNGVK